MWEYFDLKFITCDYRMYIDVYYLYLLEIVENVDYWVGWFDIIWFY